MGPDPLSLATADFRPERDGTGLVLTQQGAFLNGHETPARRDKGMGSLLDALGKELQSVQAPGPERLSDTRVG